MKIEIWSDVVCPFCYIGKRHFESALQDFPHREEVQIIWRSFQLDPQLAPEPGQTLQQHLAARKGFSPAQVSQMQEHVNHMAQQAGLSYTLDEAVVANTLDAHRLIHLAARHGLQDVAEERLFAAYLTEGKDIGNLDVLARLGTDIGLDAEEVKQVLQSQEYLQEVRQDQHRGRQIGVTGVPFFVFNEKYGVSGAQPREVLLEVLQKVREEEASVPASDNDGSFCTPESC